MLLLLCYCCVYQFHADCCVVVSISLLANCFIVVWLVSYHFFLSTCVCSWCIIYLWQLFLLNHSGHWDAYLLSRVLIFSFIHHPLSCQLLIVLCVWYGTWLGLLSDSKLIWALLLADARPIYPPKISVNMLKNHQKGHPSWLSYYTPLHVDCW